MFRADIVLEAVLIDDLSAITINLREDDTFSARIEGIFGYSSMVSGNYHLNQDTIIFYRARYSDDFIPEMAIIDRLDSAIYFRKLPNGEFDRTKSLADYFEIREILF